MNRPLAGVVLAAGLGTRLRPLTDLRPKALCPVAGRPLLDWALDRLAPHTGTGPEHLAVNAHHHADQVVARLGGEVGGRAHVSVEQPEPLGTAGALGLLRDWLDGRDVLLTNADAWIVTSDGSSEGALDGLLHGWDRERCRLLVVPAEPGVRKDFGDCRYVGACLLPWALVSELAPTPSGLYEVLWREQERQGRLELVVHDGPALDVGRPADYLRANLAAAPDGWVHPAALVEGAAARSVVGAGTVVEGTVERCVVWDGARVERHEHLVDVVRAAGPDGPVTVPAAAGA
ncbi:MAG TPA: sugar phosphate nucleotidyltransferase [Motilibacteraceae bacterium]|nr:sugar phosphate nucleotidyltransferase [Motilibacteraceae bacterium]